MAKGRILTKLTLSELSGVDDPCQEHARVSIMKRRPRVAGPQAIAKATFQEALDAQLVSQRVQNAFYGCFDNLWSRNDAFRTAMTDEIAAGGDGSVAADAWVESVKQLADNAVAAAKENGGKPTDEELSGAMDKAIAKYLSTKEQTMTISTKAALKAAVAKFDPTKSTVADRDEIVAAAATLGAEDELPVAGPLAKAAPDTRTAELEREVKVLKLAPDLRKHYDALAADKQTAFLAKDAAGQTAEVAAANSDDPVAYTTADGIEVRKSAGPAMVALAKSNDELRNLVKGLSDTSGEAAIEKALQKFPHVNKGVATTMLKSVASGDAAAKQAVNEALVAMDKAAAPAFQRMGNTGGGGIDIEKGLDTPQGVMGSIVKRIAKERNISEAHATVIATGDPEYQAAYTESLADVPAVAAYAPAS